jgi:RNA polymerase sigma-70 factor (ECF subfamily)
MSAITSLASGIGFSAILAGSECRYVRKAKAERSCPRPSAEPGFRSVSALVADLGRVAMGDARAFERVYVATSAKLYGIIVRIVRIVRIVGRRDVADEILQDVFVRVWQRAAEFDPSLGSPITWLATLARNRALDVIKRKSSPSLQECPETLEIPSDDDPFVSLARNDDRRRLCTCLERLDPEKRAIIVMAYLQSMTREDIAVRTGRPVATINTWLRRSLLELKELLGEPS